MIFPLPGPLLKFSAGGWEWGAACALSPAEARASLGGCLEEPLGTPELVSLVLKSVSVPVDAGLGPSRSPK